MSEKLIPLKLKYRQPGRVIKGRAGDPPEGTNVYQAGRFKSKSSNSGTKGANRGMESRLRPRRRSYGPF